MNQFTDRMSLPMIALIALIPVVAQGCTEGAANAQAVSTSTLATSNEQSSGGPLGSQGSASVALAAEAFGCVLADPTLSDARCQSVANVAAATLVQLRRADADTVEQLSEVLLRRARAERMSPINRLAFARWLDLGMSASREAAHARVAAQAANIQRIRRDPELSSDPDALEHAAHVDAQALAARSHLDGLRAYAHEGNDGAENATALAITIIAARLRIAEGADAALRSDALGVASDIAIESAGPAARTGAANPRAHDGAADPTSAAARTDRNDSNAAAARSALAQMGTAPCSQALGPIRTLCERSLSAIRP